MESKYRYVWHTLLGLAFTLFIAGLFFVIGSFDKEMKIGIVIAWTVSIMSLIVFISAAVYGFIVHRINLLRNSSEKIEKSLITHDSLKSMEKEINNVSSIIKSSYELATKDLLREANSFGLEMIYGSRSKVEAELEELLKKANREVDFLGICISMPTRVPEFRELVEGKAKDGVIFKFLFMNRKKKDNSTNFYQQRAKDEGYPDWKEGMGDLGEETDRNIETLRAVKSRLGNEDKGNILIGEYTAFPYMSMIIIDNEMFVGTYMFGESCPITPMYKIIKKEGGIFSTYYNHFSKLWESAEKNEQDVLPIQSNIT